MRRWNTRSARRQLAMSLLLVAPGVAWAGPATDYGLFNTGVNDLQGVLADNDVDPHYTLIEPSHVLGDPIVATSAGGFPIGPWLDDNHLSAWITPSADTNGDGDVDGEPSYVYRPDGCIVGRAFDQRCLG